MAITIKQIAEISGVSRGTVDRVINNRGKVKADTRALVMKVAKELGYQPNPAGKALAANKKKPVIGILLISEGNPFFDEVIHGMQKAAEEYAPYGVSTILETMRGFDPDEQITRLDNLKDRVNALILNPINDERIVRKIDELTEQGIFVVTINNDILGSKRAFYVGSDYTVGGATACGIMGLLTKGSANIGILTGSNKILGHTQRIHGFQAVAQKKFPAFNIISIAETIDDDIEAFTATNQMLTNHPEINAIFIAAAGTYGVCRAILALGLEKDITIVAFDITPEIKEMMERKIIDVTIYQHPYTQGNKAMNVAFSKLVNGITPNKDAHILKNEIRILENI